MKDIALYIHIPFCNSKCDYCDFYSLACDKKTKLEYLECLKKEIISKKELLKNCFIKTIYIGGGTPSVLPTKFFVELKKCLKEFCTISKDVEFTVEVNPNSFNETLAKTLKRIGVNRISIGLQTANDKLLKDIHRFHTFQQFKSAIIISKRYFSNISVDLMVGLPNQKMKDVKASLKKVLKFKPKHISCYNLIIERNTPLYNNDNLLSKVPDEETQLKMFEYIVKTLNKHNYQRYEVSNFSLKGKLNDDEYISKHNQSYWNGTSYLGFGVAAHSYINGYRLNNDRDLNGYLKNSCNVNREKITKDMQREEQIMLGLRTKWGCDIRLCDGLIVEKLVNNGFVFIKNKRIIPTNKGFNVLNLIIKELV